MVTGADIKIAAHSHWMLPAVVKYASAVVLLAILGYALFSKTKTNHK